MAQVRLVSKDIFLTLAYFSLEASISGKGSVNSRAFIFWTDAKIVAFPFRAVKAAKTILKIESKNLLFWDAYARIERSNGNLNSARNVYMQALSLSQSFDDKEKVDIPLLWRAWTELEWEDGRHSAALVILVASSAATTNNAVLGESKCCIFVIAILS